MKYSECFGRMVAVLAGLLMAGGVVSNAFAAGTASGTTISNSASVSYEVGSVPQPQINSAAVTFVVDTKIDLTVSRNGAAVSVTPGATEQVLSFTVTNTGNATQDFNLSATTVGSGTGNATDYGSGAGNDNFDATTVSIYVDTNGNGTYESGTDTATSINDLAADASVSVFIVASIPANQVTGDIASYHLVAEARDAASGNTLVQTSGADTIGSVDIVFADGQGTDTINDVPRDAKHSSQNDYIISTAALTVSKTSVVISDPFSSTNPKRIPGAVVEYIITIDNSSGAEDATNIVLTDLLDSTNLAFSDSAAYAGNDIELNINGTVTTYTGTDSDDDGGDFGITTTNTVTVDYDAAGTGFTVPAGQSATVKFRVTIN